MLSSACAATKHWLVITVKYVGESSYSYVLIKPGVGKKGDKLMCTKYHNSQKDGNKSLHMALS